MRKKIVAGNWKMNLQSEDVDALVQKLNNLNFPKDVEIKIFPSFIYLDRLVSNVKKDIQVGAQNFFYEQKGAFTGEVSYEQLASIGIKDVLIGHSERRSLFQESEAMLKEKVDVAIANGLNVIFCCGEPLEIRESNKQEEFVKEQLEKSLFHLSAEQLMQVVIAYEPVWAIGTGVTASSNQAEEMHLSIRNWLKDKYNEEVANNVSILYGGSCNASNAKELFACPNVDGGLIGGAALDATSFSSIANSY